MVRRYRKFLAGAGAAPLVLLAAACGSAATSSSESAGTVSAPQTSPRPVTGTTARAISPASSAAASVRPSPTATATLTGCAAQAAHTYYYILSARNSATGGVLLTGHIATMICGGPDDWHFEDAGTIVPASVLPGADVEVLDMTSGISMKTIPLNMLITALAHDQSSRTFLVRGPLTAVTGLTEIYHP